MISAAERAKLRWGSQRRWRARQRRPQEALATLQRLAVAEARARAALRRSRMIFAMALVAAYISPQASKVSRNLGSR